MKVSKTEFKAHALEIFREIEKSGKSYIITDRGTPKIEIRKISEPKVNPLQRLKGSVLKYNSPTAPVAEEDWENL